MMASLRIVLMFWSLAAGSGAYAHAFFDHADPPVGSTVHSAPARVEVWFSQDLEPAFSTLKVVDGSGKQVDRRDQSVPEGNRRRMTVSLPPLAPGRYRVVWRALSADTHVTEGDFTFVFLP